jgi:hypothetical protein
VDEIQHSLEQFESVVIPDAPAYYNALPQPGSQGFGNHRLNVLTPVERNKACFDADAMLSEPS